MAKESLPLVDLHKLAKFIQTLSDEDLDKAVVLTIAKFPKLIKNLDQATDLAGLVKFERYRRKRI